jgi:nitrate reductase delta subunit
MHMAAACFSPGATTRTEPVGPYQTRGGSIAPDDPARAPTMVMIDGRAPLRLAADQRATADPAALAAGYVPLFEFRRQRCLHVTYYARGDTRKRGVALVIFAAGM